ncbi:ABC transporter permease subunit [Mycoplasma struthionis]|uniref:ABC transporter permease subunit n=1 Tax=Mycoplasma struthionis TaxID=538220 RepID=A0A3G8LIT6_9MOLU|nr:ABC transporter permease subunit [Mycoplasma struthionis]AZG68790.1 ABC transporter permease subunit [Mycoplasma struthionis]TPI01561.1 ABC transporter permease subunit [Mycoplasma struthionis]
MYFDYKNLFKRIAIYLLIFFIVLSITYFAINVLIEPQVKKNLAVSENIEKNLFIRYLNYLRDLITFKRQKIFSNELKNTNLSISILFFSQFKWTFLFTILIFFLSLIIGNLLGIFSAYKYNKTADFIINIIIGFIAVIPLIIIAVLALGFSETFGYPSQFLINNSLTFASLLVPITFTSFGTISLIHARARKVVKEILNSEYYLFALSLGQDKKRLFLKQVLKNLIISELQVLIPYYLLLFSISLVVERIFSIPGQSIFIAYAFSKAEINLIMFYFWFSFITILISRFIFSIVLDILNPVQKVNKSLFFIKRKGVKHA